MGEREIKAQRNSTGSLSVRVWATGVVGNAPGVEREGWGGGVGATHRAVRMVHPLLGHGAACHGVTITAITAITAITITAITAIVIKAITVSRSRQSRYHGHGNHGNHDHGNHGTTVTAITTRVAITENSRSGFMAGSVRGLDEARKQAGGADKKSQRSLSKA